MRATRLGLLACAALLVSAPATAKDLLGVACSTPAPVHCADSGCTIEDTQNLGNAVETKKARPADAKIYLYPKCEGGRVVADIVRLDKGHTEGLEPRVTEEIVKLMMAAK